jgi:outer membrane receptor for ferrienterochelin and colicins
VSFNVQGQVSVQGKLVDEQKNPIAFAAVGIKSTTVGTATDENGFFELLIKEKGVYTLQYSSMGYHPVQQSITADKSLNLGVVQMKTNSLGLEEVVVTGTMKPVFVSQSPIKVEVVTSAYLDAFLPAASSSILESVTLINGVQEVVACGVCFTNSISINGLPGPYTAVLMDGTPIYGSLASVYGLNGIPNMIIDRIEVIKGPSSTLYGSEAVAGVINIITKDPAKQPLVSIDIMGTSQSEVFGNVSIAPQIGQSSGYIGLNYGYVTSFEDRNGDGFGDGLNLDRYSLFTKWNIARKSKKPFSISGKYYYEDRRNGVEGFMKNRSYKELRGDSTVYGESIYTKRAELFGTYAFATKEALKVDYSFSYHDQDSYYGADHYTATQAIGFANLIYSKSLGAHDMVFGLTNRLQSYNDNTVATANTNSQGEIIDAPDNQYIPGVFAQDEWKLTNKSTVLLGMRLDHYNSHGLIWSPRVNYKLKSGDWTTWRVNFGTGFRVVNLFTEDHAFVTGQRTIEITEDLQPEESYNLSTNFNHVFTIGQSQGMIDVDAFYTYFTNKIIPDYSDACYSNRSKRTR